MLFFRWVTHIVRGSFTKVDTGPEAPLPERTVLSFHLIWGRCCRIFVMMEDVCEFPRSLWRCIFMVCHSCRRTRASDLRNSWRNECWNKVAPLNGSSHLERWDKYLEKLKHWEILWHHKDTINAQLFTRNYYLRKKKHTQYNKVATCYVHHITYKLHKETL